jgi:hypothetical protein
MISLLTAYSNLEIKKAHLMWYIMPAYTTIHTIYWDIFHLNGVAGCRVAFCIIQEGIL